MQTFIFELRGKTGSGNSYTTRGTVYGDIGRDHLPLIQSVLRESFQQLTNGKAVFGEPGVGCRGPYSITSLKLCEVGQENITGGWKEGAIRLTTEGTDVVVSVERDGKYAEIIRTSGADSGVPVSHFINPSGINHVLGVKG